MATSQDELRIGHEFEGNLILAVLMVIIGANIVLGAIQYYMVNDTFNVAVVVGYAAVGSVLALGGVFVYVRGRRRFYLGLRSL